MFMYSCILTYFLPLDTDFLPPCVCFLFFTPAVHVYVHFSGLDFHEDLHRIGAKEGLKGRKLQKAMESYAWNITVLKVSASKLALVVALVLFR